MYYANNRITYQTVFPFLGKTVFFVSNLNLLCAYGIIHTSKEGAYMEVKTHASIGVATAIAVTTPKNLPELVITCAAGLIGSLICDVDASKSTAHNHFTKANAYALVTIIIIYA